MKDHSLIKRILKIAEEESRLTVSELTDVLIESLHLRGEINSWPDSDRRLANVEAFRRIAAEYENWREENFAGASAAGFLLYLEEVASDEQDEMGSGGGKNAVEIVTYHKSKGLEWPVTILYSLD